MKSEIYEVKKVEEQDGAEAAAQAEEEIIRLAHLPDDIKEETVLLENDDQPEIFEEGTYNEKWR